MAPKVLVFESDPAFADELRSELGLLGCEVTVVDDGNIGLQHAFAERPDLILLSIELPRMNGFSVCNRVKKDPNLKDVPLIIMSSESSEETFEQHKKLRTRAEDYVRKPVAFGELLERIQAYYPLGHHPTSEADIVIDDEIELGMSDYEDEEVLNEETTKANRRLEMPSRSVDADVEAFAESAFGRMTRSDLATVPQEREVPADGATASEVEHLRQALAAAEERIGAMTRQLEIAHDDFEKLREQGELAENLAADLADARSEIEVLRQAAQDSAGTLRQLAEAKLEIERLQIEATDAGRLAREVDELRSKLTTSLRPGAISSREFLDLREALNHKDKEILNLRELVSRKDKEIMESQDRALVSERARADLDGRLLTSERELAELRERADALEADCELAKKARDDFRGRLERAAGDVEDRDRQLAALAQRHTQDVEAQQATVASLRAEHETALANEREARARAEDEANERLRAELASARSEHETAIASLRSEYERGHAKLRSEHDAAIASALEKAAQDSEDARAREAAHLRQQHANEEAALRHAQDQAIEALRREAAEAARHATEAREEDVAAVRRDAEARLAQALSEANRHEVAAVEAVRREFDEHMAALQSGFEREIGAARDQIAQLDAEGAKLRASLTEAHERVGRLDMDAAALRSELATMRDAKASADAAHAAALSEVEGRLAEASGHSAQAENTIVELRATIGSLEGRLAGTLAEIDSVRQQQAEAASRADRARAKWDADRQSLDRAKDALAAALLQIEEAEGRTA